MSEAAVEGGGEPAAVEGGGGLLGATIPVADDGFSSTPTSDVIEGNQIAEPSIYGELQVQWPEGIDPDITNDPALKPYVSEDGQVNMPGALKSLAHAQRSIGRDRVMLPHENTTPEEWTDFHTKVFGYTADRNNYEVDYDTEAGNLDEDFVKQFTDYAHENMYPPALLEDVFEFLDATVQDHSVETEEADEQYAQQSHDYLKGEWGVAFDRKINSAKMVLDKFGDDEVMDHINNSGLKNDPILAKFLANLGEQLFHEDSFKGNNSSGYNVYTPDQAQSQIDSVYGDADHPFHKNGHPGHAKAQEDMLKLFAMKKGERVK